MASKSDQLGKAIRSVGVAVVARHLGIAVERVSIVGDRSPCGRCEFTRPDEVLDPHGLAVAVLAGSAALVHFRDRGESPSIVGGYEDDRRRALRSLQRVHATGLEDAFARAEAQAGTHVVDLWPSITLISGRLLGALELDGFELNAIQAGRYLKSRRAQVLAQFHDRR